MNTCKFSFFVCRETCTNNRKEAKKDIDRTSSCENNDTNLGYTLQQVQEEVKGTVIGSVKTVLKGALKIKLQ